MLPAACCYNTTCSLPPAPTKPLQVKAAGEDTSRQLRHWQFDAEQSLATDLLEIAARLPVRFSSKVQGVCIGKVRARGGGKGQGGREFLECVWLFVCDVRVS